MSEDKATRPALKLFLNRVFKYLSGYVDSWLQFIGVRSVVSLTVEHTWDGRAVDMIEAGKRQAAELARQF
jgi:FMN-dependent NADH-azoreductase